MGTKPAFLEILVLINMSAAPTPLGNLNASVVLFNLMHEANHLKKILIQNLAVAIGIKEEREDTTATLHLHFKFD